MSLVIPAVYDGAAQRKLYPGDLLALNEKITSDATAGALNITGALMASGILSRSGPGANYADVFPTSADLVNSLLNNAYIGGGALSAPGISPGTSFRFTLINTVAFTNTPTIGTGGTLGSNTAIAASSAKEYLITITNGTPQRATQGNTTNASAVITGMYAGQLQFLTAGMLVSGTGIQAGSTILSIQPGVGVTLSLAATATGSSVALTFNPTYRVDSLGQFLL